MIIKKCLICGKKFQTANYYIKIGKGKFCSRKCYYKYQKQNLNKTCFKKGIIPWNKNKKGIHLSPKSEFKKGQKGIRWKPVDTITIRIEKSGTMRRWIKIKEPNIWIEYAKYLWLKAGKKLQKGLCLHHQNLDSLDDRLENFCLVSRQNHPKLHNRWNTKNIIFKNYEKRNKKLR